MGFLVVILAFSTAIGLGVYLNGGFNKNKSIASDNQSQPSLTDADIIALASQHKEGISIAAVCLASNVSAANVKEQMETLREQGLLYLSIDENGAEKYSLTDASLISSYKKNDPMK